MLKKLMVLLVIFVFLNSCDRNSKKDTIILSSKNVVILRGVVDTESVSKIMNTLLKKESIYRDSESLYLFLHTPGGSIVAGQELIDFLKAFNPNTKTIVSFAASMGFVIHENLGERLVLENSVLMAHKAYGGFEGEFPGKLTNRYNFWLRKIEYSDTIISKRLGMSLKEFRDLHENEFWVSGFDSIKMNVSDRVVNVMCDSTLSGSYYEKFRFFGLDIQIEWSECPLITYPLDIKVTDSYSDSKKVNDVTQFFKKLYNYKTWDANTIKNVNGFNTNLNDIKKLLD